MSPEYGATMGYFPIDQESVDYLRATGRSEEQCLAFENYFRAQKMFGMPLRSEIDYSVDIDLDLAQVQPSVAGPKRPQDRINLPDLEKTFRESLEKPVRDGGYGKQNADLREKHLVELNGSAPRDEEMFSTDKKEDQGISAGDELNKIEMIANRPTPDPGKEIEAESRDVFTHGRTHVGHGSVLIAAITSCTNTSNPSVMIAAGLLAKKAVEHGLHVDPGVKTSLAPGSRVVSDYLDKTGLQKYLDQLGFNLVGYGCTTCIGNSGPLHANIEKTINKYDLIAASVLSGNRNFEARVHQHIKANFLMSPPLVVAFALAGRVHINLSPAGAIKETSPAEKYLKSRGIEPRDFNSYGSRRGNDLVMTRGTFANVRIKNLMVPGTEGGVTKYFANGEGEEMSIFDAAMKYAKTNTPLMILAGHEYGTGSSRDWAAKGTRLLGVKAVVAASFERIHRSNLVGMGVLPLQFPDGTTAQSLGLEGSEIFSITDLSETIKPGQTVMLEIEGKDRQKRSVPAKVRIDTPIEVDYYRHGGILPFVLRQLLLR